MTTFYFDSWGSLYKSVPRSEAADGRYDDVAMMLGGTLCIPADPSEAGIWPNFGESPAAAARRVGLFVEGCDGEPDSVRNLLSTDDIRTIADGVGYPEVPAMRFLDGRQVLVTRTSDAPHSALYHTRVVDNGVLVGYVRQSVVMPGDGTSVFTTGQTVVSADIAAAGPCLAYDTMVRVLTTEATA